MNVYELNIDGLVGPTHHYAGLSKGNVASTQNALCISNPKAAALQGIHKMRLLHHLGVKQAFMPPQPRPNLALLRRLGFMGTDAQVLRKAHREAPTLLSAAYSASNMWTANAATISPSTDTADHRVHFTAANLISHLHRHQEADFTWSMLQQIFHDETYFHHHQPLPATQTIRDEGAANHTRLCQTYADEGIHLFVYNQQMLPQDNPAPIPQQYPARQTREASEAIVRSHQLHPDYVLLAQQNPGVIDLGVFHNDVIAVGNQFVFLVHEEAFVNQALVLDALKARSNDGLEIIEIKRDQVSVLDAVNSYLFNSQLITRPNQQMALIAPVECQHITSVKDVIDALITSSNNPISTVHYLDLKQSMRNGGGPACLRLRIVLNEDELNAMHQAVLVNDTRLDTLEQWVNKHYRDELHVDDLQDPAFMDEVRQALDELDGLLNLAQKAKHP
jgi:succinylarginine dihydrolase